MNNMIVFDEDSNLNLNIQQWKLLAPLRSMSDSTPPMSWLGKSASSTLTFLLFTRQPNDFWLTTGMYPQELTITFNQARVINEVKFLTSGVKKVEIQGCQTVNGNNFNVIAESKELTGSRG